jgi:two-component system nitrate/nitrite response regulator NarL
MVIADRYPVVLLGLRNVLEAQPDFEVVASCCNGASCIEAVRRWSPDIVVVDISMPGLTGLEILGIVSTERLLTRVVFFAASAEEGELVMSAPAGAYAVLLKDATPEVLVQSLRRVAGGERLSPLPSDPSLSREQGAATENALTALTERERQIMRLVSEGLSNKEIARRLNITDGTIKVHLHNIFQKLEITNRTVLAALAVSQNESADPSSGNRISRIPALGGPR